jgi:hypothetical protein
MQASLQASITWPKKSSMLISLNLGIVVVDLGMAMDFDANIFIFVVYCRLGGKRMEACLFGF